jgi:hypothetical protein
VNQWYLTASRKASCIHCPKCDAEIEATVPFADHHPRQCPNCTTELFLFTLTKQHLAICLESAPALIAKALRECQCTLDEIEFVELVVLVESLLGIEPH